MFIDSFIWLPQFVEKIESKHNVSPDEVEEVFFNNPRYRFIESGNRSGEDVYSARGQTNGGRYLMIIFIQKPQNSGLIVSARTMTPKERKQK